MGGNTIEKCPVCGGEMEYSQGFGSGGYACLGCDYTVSMMWADRHNALSLAVQVAEMFNDDAHTYREGNQLFFVISEEQNELVGRFDIAKKKVKNEA